MPPSGNQWVLTLAILLADATTGSLKLAFELPRPVYLDAQVGEPLDPSPPPTVFANGGADTFWSLPKPEAIAAVREYHRVEDDGADGFPSGHVASAAALSFGIALLFHVRWGVSFAIAWTVMMAVSRMYLGRHFLADVIAGAFIGVAVVVYVMMLTRAFRENENQSSRTELVALTVLLLLWAILPIADLEAIGMVLGVSLPMVMATYVGLPNDKAPLAKRALRVLLAFAVYFTITLFMDLVGVGKSVIGEMVIGLFSISLTLIATLAVSQRFGWFQRTPRPFSGTA
ncbi:MAG: phosphatase PAP2 family protein [Pseudomonadota bacterium]